ATDESLAVGQAMHRRMSEHRRRADDDAAPLQQSPIGVEADLAERDDDAHARKRREFSIEMRQTVGDLFGRRLVGRRRAANGRGQYVMSRNARRFSRPIRWQYSRRRGQRSQETIASRTFSKARGAPPPRAKDRALERRLSRSGVAATDLGVTGFGLARGIARR